MLLPAAVALLLIIGLSMATARVHLQQSQSQLHHHHHQQQQQQQQQHQHQQQPQYLQLTKHQQLAGSYQRKMKPSHFKKFSKRNSHSSDSGNSSTVNIAGLLDQINPWLSACDLTTGQDFEPHRCRLYASGSDRMHPLTSRCRQCNDDANQCLYFRQQDIRSICDDDVINDSSNRKKSKLKLLQKFRLAQCCERSLDTVISERNLEKVIDGGSECHRILQSFLEIDQLAAHISCEFAEILERYDCDQPYSLVFHCEHCKSAYREWVCSSLLPYYDRPLQVVPAGGRTKLKTTSPVTSAAAIAAENVTASVNATTLTTGPSILNGNNSTSKRTNQFDRDNEITRKIRPCRSLCHNVEKKCPYLLPGDRSPSHSTQYAGQSTFLCRDPNIEESKDQKLRTLHGSEDCCYRECTEADDDRFFDRTNSKSLSYCVQCPYGNEDSKSSSSRSTGSSNNSSDSSSSSSNTNSNCNPVMSSTSLSNGGSNLMLQSQTRPPFSLAISTTTITPSTSSPLTATTKCQIQYYENIHSRAAQTTAICYFNNYRYQFQWSVIVYLLIFFIC